MITISFLTLSLSLGSKESNHIPPKHKNSKTYRLLVDTKPNFISDSVDKYLLNNNNKDIRMTTMNTVLVSLLLTLNSDLPTG